ncbi:penicillin-binding protein activator LpoB [Helicobacter enhydrae]|uniref:Penicillin-binding protein activator LpoB n=1 Tax=Helicobacter enhydrae TaxID=222136 RepID=A0A1B1U4A9_9HELI|nr:penicillin-binding protein activator LpoB [Helicobacter enhydrae]ANV97593.1 penicillin-binding protein activator LpoB [Helicobacter enhydrae]
MKQVVLSLIVALGFFGCAGGARYISTNSQEYVSAGLDLNDLKKATQESLESLYKSRFFQKISFEQPKTIAVSDFINDTTIKLDMEQITARIVEELQNSGKFRITRAMSGSGGSTDSMIAQSRTARDNEEFNQETVIEKGELVGASLSLTGKVGQRITSIGGDQRVDYFFKIEINDLKSGLLQWSRTIDISKISSGKSSVW